MFGVPLGKNRGSNPENRAKFPAILKKVVDKKRQHCYNK